MLNSFTQRKLWPYAAWHTKLTEPNSEARQHSPQEICTNLHSHLFPNCFYSHAYKVQNTASPKEMKYIKIRTTNK